MDRSLYESSHQNRAEQAYGFAFGRITRVYPKERMVEVVTFMGMGSLNDQYIPKCQWLNVDSNPEGDEFTSIPRKNSICLVFWVDGEPFVFGFFKPLHKKGTALGGNEPTKLNEGDKVIATNGGNRVTIKANGSIEMISKDTLKRTMFPTGSRIIDLCRRFSLSTDGGAIEWGADPKTLAAKFTQEYYWDLLRTFVVFEERGALGATTIYRTTVGAAVPGQAGSTGLTMYTKRIDVTGDYEETITPPAVPGTPIGYKKTLTPLGQLHVTLGPIPNFDFLVEPTGATTVSVNKLWTLTVNELGAMEVKNNIGSLVMSELGDISLTGFLSKIDMPANGDIRVNNGVVIITAGIDGDVKVETPNKVTLDAQAGIDIKSMGYINLESLGPVMVKAKSTITLDGGTGATDFLLTFPTTISPFTGNPLTPFGTSIMVSK